VLVDIGLLHEAPGRVQRGFTLARTARGHGWAQAALQPLCTRLGTLGNSARVSRCA
jgi:hypothetical protein